MLDLPPQPRQFSPALAVPYTGTHGPGRFTVNLQDASGSTVNSADLLQFNWLPRVTDSQPGCRISGRRRSSTRTAGTSST